MNDALTTDRGGCLRTLLFGFAVSLGSLQFVGGILWALAGAGVYGSPLHGGAPWVNRVLLFLATGPMSLLPASVLAIWWPRLAGAWLTVTAVVSAIAAILVMHPILPGSGEWSSGGESVAYYTLKWSLALIVPFSLPMLILGVAFLWSPGSTKIGVRVDGE